MVPWAAPDPGLCQSRKDRLWVLLLDRSGLGKLMSPGTRERRKDCPVGQKAVLGIEPAAIVIPQNTAKEVPESLCVWNLL